MTARYYERYGRTGVRLTGNDAGMRDLITSEQLFLPTLLKHADESEQRAKMLAESTRKRVSAAGGNRGSARRTGRSYRQSFEVEFGVGPTRDGTRRVYARLINTNPFAFYIEYGNANLTPARRVLRRAAGINRFDAQGDKF